MTRVQYAVELKKILANLNANNLTSQLSLNVLKMEETINKCTANFKAVTVQGGTPVNKEKLIDRLLVLKEELAIEEALYTVKKEVVKGLIKTLYPLDQKLLIERYCKRRTVASLAMEYNYSASYMYRALNKLFNELLTQYIEQIQTLSKNKKKG